ncbi:PAS domain-containing sensor histidine kinase [Culturomica massiliensis]|jgi:signal transduction histidine kinase|uniref:PAS domain-containing sensor histidine kinase n=1 Tax=Culturomica massiliensis TaxID=1841857 RepID=UPI0008389733|nr:PAS domain-containing sensor histidine kinase [Culturomica massiliensis]
MKKADNNFLSELMTKANMGWWEADLESQNYICSGYISTLLGLKEDGVISFDDFNKRIIKEEQHHTTVHSFDNNQQIPEVVYLLDTCKGAIWIRSKICFQRTDENGKNKIYGIAEAQDGPDMASAYQALQRSEQILYNIYKNLPVGIELYDKDGILVDLNNKELDLFYLERKEDLLGINIFDNPIFPEEMKEKLKKKEDADFTFRYDFSKINGYYKTRKKTGTIDLVTKVTVLYDNKGNPINYLLINADKTETTIAYNKIQEFESYFELVGDYAKVGYANCNILTNEGYALKSWYKNIGEQEGRPLSEIIGIYEHFHSEDRAVINQFISDVKKGQGNKLSREVRVIREDGSYTWTHVNLLLNKYAPQDHIIEIISINYDITELKKTEEQLIKAKNKAEQSDRLKSAFLANISHEIRTPLNAIVGFSSLLPNLTDTEELELYYTLIDQNNNLLLKLLNDILDFSKIEAGHTELHPDWFNLSDLIAETIVENTPHTPPNVKLLSKIPKQDYIVELDRLQTKQILNKLISNAQKNTIQGHIEISYKTNKQNVQINVTDTGHGIPKDKLKIIFERFEKLDPFAQGVGLGLPIIKSIVDMMKGNITVDSKVGAGSTFKVTLPCRIKKANESVSGNF